MKPSKTDPLSAQRDRLMRELEGKPPTSKTLGVYLNTEAMELLQRAEAARSISSTEPIPWTRLATAAILTAAQGIVRGEAPAHHEIWPMPALSVRERAGLIAALIQHDPRLMPPQLRAIATGDGAFETLSDAELADLVRKVSQP